MIPGNQFGLKYSNKQFLDLYKQGLCDTAIARLMGCSSCTIANKRKIFGLKSNKKIIIDTSMLPKFENITKENILEYKRLYGREYYKANKDKVNEKNRKWAITNKEKARNYARNYEKKRRWTDPIYRLAKNVRLRTNMAYKGLGWKKGKNKELLGCDFEQLKLYLESKFLEGMSWNNYGKWHIDHIIGLCNAKNEEELAKLCYYTNLQPLWAIDNLKKKRFI